MWSPRLVRKKWVAVGGMARSRKDGRTVYAEARKLALAHGVDPKRCVLIDTRDFSDRQMACVAWRISVAWWWLPVLRPLADGRYQEERVRLMKENGYTGRDIR